MEYEFVRFKNLATDEESHKWWFAAKTARQVMEHAEKFFKPTMIEGYSSAAHDAVEAIFKHGGIMNHPTNEVASSIEAITEIKGYKRSSPLALFNTANELMSTINLYGKSFRPLTGIMIFNLYPTKTHS